MPPNHPDAICFNFEQDNPTAGQLIAQRAYLQIHHHTGGRNSSRRNAKLFQAILKQSASWESSVAMKFNLAELLYNGVPGIPSDLEQSMNFYVGTLESASERVLNDLQFMRFMKNNMIEVSYHLGHQCLREVTSRLDKLLIQHQNSDLALLRDMIAGRTADMGSKRKQAIRFYKSAKLLGDKIGDTLSSLESEKRIAVLKAGSSEVIDQIKKKYSYLRKKAIGELNDRYPSLKKCMTEGPQQPEIIRIAVAVNRVDDLPSELTDLIEKKGATVSESKCSVCTCCGDPDLLHKFNKCGGCGQVRYCSKTCQKAHWLEHKRSCRKRTS